MKNINKVVSILVILSGLLFTVAMIIYAEGKPETKPSEKEQKEEKEKKEAEKIEKLLKDEMDVVRGIKPHSKDYYRNIDEVFKYGVKMLPHLKKYLTDESRDVRQNAYYTLNSLHLKIRDDSLLLKERQEIMELLLESVKNDTILKPKDLFVERAEDFSDKSKEIIIEMVNSISPSRCTNPGLTRLIGVADMKSLLPRLGNMLADETKFRGHWLNDPNWTARLARARMGVQEDINRCIELVDSEIDIKLKIGLLGDLQYIRQPEVIPVLVKYLNDDTKIAPNHPICFWAIEALSKMLENFPIKGIGREGPEYTQKEIEICRKWMVEQKEFKIIR